MKIISKKYNTLKTKILKMIGKKFRRYLKTQIALYYITYKI